MGKPKPDPITMVSDEAAEAAAKAESEAAKAESEAAEAAAKAARPKHVIAEGCALTEGTRILGPGDAVTADALAGGGAAFKHFLKIGHIVAND